MAASGRTRPEQPPGDRGEDAHEPPAGGHFSNTSEAPPSSAGPGGPPGDVVADVAAVELTQRRHRGAPAAPDQRLRQPAAQRRAEQAQRRRSPARPPCRRPRTGSRTPRGGCATTGECGATGPAAPSALRQRGHRSARPPVSMPGTAPGISPITIAASSSDRRHDQHQRRSVSRGTSAPRPALPRRLCALDVLLALGGAPAQEHAPGHPQHRPAGDNR